MAFHTADENSDEKDLDDDALDDQGPQDCDLNESDDGGEGDESDSADCPACGASVYIDADRCPHCGEWITSTAGQAGPGRWAVVVAVVLLIAMLLWLLP